MCLSISILKEQYELIWRIEMMGIIACCIMMNILDLKSCYQIWQNIIWTQIYFAYNLSWNKNIKQIDKK
jgi:hypothetical protein